MADPKPFIADIPTMEDAIAAGDGTLHDLRAMAGTNAEAEGQDPTKLLGHTDRRTTQIYLRDRSAQVVAGPSSLPSKRRKSG